MSRKWLIQLSQLGVILFVMLFGFLAMLSPSYHAQETDSNSSRLSPLESAASCENVSYGTINTVAEQDVSPEIPHFVVPPNADGATLTDIGLYVLAISDIDPVNNHFTVEAFLDMVWCDPREGFDSETLGWHEKIFLEEDAAGELQLIWWPDITFPNAVEDRSTENLKLVVLEDGTVDYQERFAVTLEANFDLQFFPFDTQSLTILIESLAWSDDYLVFHEKENMIGFSDRFELPEWNWNPDTDLKTEVRTMQEIRDTAPFSEFMVELIVNRDPNFYILKVLFPMVLIVALSWSVFWMDESSLGERLGISFTGLLTVVAYQFIVGDALPRLSYITFMDALINYSFVMMALTVVENVLVNILRDDHNMTMALRVDRVSRLVFPIVYVIGLGLIIVIFGVV